ncbi:filamin-A isoform X3 [Aphis craccivora]|uniref:Filamin-A isoform X3 n=1 Tax=Aphis craccivora TaxID=307492 RepID=A0A6G0ZN60_APHCR|nr:filamin-A isoform X3 [Aphis craccivora]
MQKATEGTVGVKRLPRDFAEQLRFDEYAQQTTTTTSSTTTTTNGNDYRPVSLDKIPVPSCGGHLTGENH